MFIFTRPLAAVAAGLGTALLVVIADELCQCAPTPAAAAPAPLVRYAVHESLTCNAVWPCGIVRPGS
jgi:hypothetical protein